LFAASVSEPASDVYGSWSPEKPTFESDQPLVEERFPCGARL
jgi:hypothetical protein